MKGQTAMEWLLKWCWLILIVIIVAAAGIMLLGPKVTFFFQADELKYPNEYQSCLRLTQSQGDTTPEFRDMLTRIRCSFKVIRCKTYNGTEWCKEEQEDWETLPPT